MPGARTSGDAGAGTAATAPAACAPRASAASPAALASPAHAHAHAHAPRRRYRGCLALLGVAAVAASVAVGVASASRWSASLNETGGWGVDVGRWGAVPPDPRTLFSDWELPGGGGSEDAWGSFGSLWSGNASDAEGGSRGDGEPGGGDGGEAPPPGDGGELPTASDGDASPPRDGEAPAGDGGAAAGDPQAAAEPPAAGGAPAPPALPPADPAPPDVAGRPVPPQLAYDLAPWRLRGGGISLDEIDATRSLRAPLIRDQPAIGTGIVTAIIRGGVPYMREGEVPAMLAQYGVGSKGKLKDFHYMLHAIARWGPRVPDVTFLWNVHPWPLLTAAAGPANKRGEGPAADPSAFAARRGDGRGLPDFDALFAAPPRPAPRGLAPVFSLCKMAGDLDVLYPNMYFQSPRFWARAVSSIRRAGAASPWDRRRGTMWWRGASGWMWPAAAPRALTVARWDAARWSDFAFTSNWPPILASWAKSPWYRALGGRRARGIRSGWHTRTPMEVVARYKYSLHLPGSYGATYSRTLQFLVWAGTTIFLYDCPYFEFYYAGLRPWVHYIPANTSDLEAKYRWAEHHQTAARAVAAASVAFAEANLTTARVFGYWVRLLREYAALQNFTVALPADACTCWPVRNRQTKPAYIPRRAKRCSSAICDFAD